MKNEVISTDVDFNKLLMKLGNKAKNACLLEGEDGGWDNRLAWNPCDQYVLKAGKSIEESFYQFIESHQNKGHLVIGFLNYDLGYSLHGMKRIKKDKLGLSNVVVFAYDNYLEKNSNKITVRYKNNAFIAEIEKLSRIKSGSQRNIEDIISFGKKWDRELYKKAFEKIRRYIYDGVIYQINLTQRLEAKTSENPRILYNKLAEKNKAKMKIYFEADDFEIISMSPERFIKTNGSTIITTPIKGTRPRGIDEREDKKNKQDLIDDEKEKAELNMITDLLRNDLGKVCKTGSVSVVKKREIEKLSKVIHTFSLIKGQLKDGMSPIKALVSMFPGGSITGCPKRRAIEIIDELELDSRSAYCGSIFCLDEKGNLDSNILIRTIIKKGDFISLSVGGGIVYDSKESREYQETLDKATSITEVLA